MKLYELAVGDKFTFPYFPDTTYELEKSVGQVYWVHNVDTDEVFSFDGSSPVLYRGDSDVT